MLTFKTIDETIITFHDENWNIISANKLARKVLKLPALEGKEIKCYKYFHGKDHPPEKCPLYQCIRNRESVSFEIFEPYLRKRMKISVFPQFDNNDKFTGLIHFARDTTYEHKLPN